MILVKHYPGEKLVSFHFRLVVVLRSFALWKIQKNGCGSSEKGTIYDGGKYTSNHGQHDVYYNDELTVTIREISFHIMEPNSCTSRTQLLNFS